MTGFSEVHDRTDLLAVHYQDDTKASIASKFFKNLSSEGLVVPQPSLTRDKPNHYMLTQKEIKMKVHSTDDYSALYDHLDKVLPQFGLDKKADHWLATKGVAPCCGSKAADHLYVYKDNPYGLKCHRCDQFTHLSKVGGPALLALAGLIPGTPPPAQDPVPDPVPALDQEACLRLVSLFQEHLHAGEAGSQALEYLRARGLTDAVIKEMGYGLHPGPDIVNKHGLIQDLLACKVDSSDWTGRIVVPYVADGRIIGFWGRHPHNNAERKYLFSSGTNKAFPYGLDAVQPDQPVLAVEGLMSRDILVAQGIPNVISVGGSTITAGQVRHLKARGVPVILSFDYDPESAAGEKGTAASIELLNKTGIRCYVISPESLKDVAAPNAKEDPDSYIMRHGVKAYRTLMNIAIEGTVYLVRQAINGLQPDNQEEVDRAFDTATRTAGNAGAATVQRIVEVLADRMRMDIDKAAVLLEESRQRCVRQEQANALEASLRRAGALVSVGNIADARRLIEKTLPAFDVTEQQVLPSFFDHEAFLAEVSQQRYDQRATGLVALDEKVSILPGELVILCARPRHGKSSMAYNWFLHWVETYSDTSIFFTHELPLAHMMARLATTWIHKHRRNRLNYKDDIVKNYRLLPSGSPAMPQDAQDAFKRFGEYGRQHRMIAAHQPGWNARQIVSYTDNIHEEHPVGGVIIDYVEMIPPLDNTVIREQQLSQTVHELRLMANRLNIPVVLLSQISRDNKVPTLEGLRYSGALEQEASTVIGLNNVAQESSRDAAEGGIAAHAQQDRVPIEVIALKNRGGMQGTSPFEFDMTTGFIADHINPFPQYKR